jgi:hypothetical protein
MGSFDPDRFMNQSFDAPNDTTMIPCPAGEWVGLTEEPVLKEIVSKKTGISYPQLTINIAIDDPAVTEKTNRKPTKVRFQSLLDLNEAGDLDMGPGKNIALGRLREACGVNRPGQRFNIRDLAGKTVKARVSHRPDDSDPSVVYDEVKAVTKA